MASKKPKKNKKMPHTKAGEEVRDAKPADERKVAAYERLMIAEERLYELWERRGTGMDWIGEAVGSPVEAYSGLWVADLGERVAALGGYLELVAVFPDQTVTLLMEPGPAAAPKDAE